MMFAALNLTYPAWKGWINLIKIVDLGYQYVNFGAFDIQRPQGTGDFLFLYFRCPTEVWLDGRYQLLPENTYFLYQKGAPQYYRHMKGNFINDWIHFDIEPYNDFFEKLDIPFQTPITLTYNKEICDMIGDLQIEYFSYGKQHDQIMSQKAGALFHKFSDLYHFSKKSNAKMTDYKRDFVDLRRRLQNYEYCPANAGEVADSLNISVSYLQHLYKEFFGVSIHQDIIKARIDHASHLLHGTKYPISEIAALCGYDNLEHFSRQFKKWKGCSPRNYRSQLNQIAQPDGKKPPVN